MESASLVGLFVDVVVLGVPTVVVVVGFGGEVTIFIGVTSLDVSVVTLGELLLVLVTEVGVVTIIGLSVGGVTTTVGLKSCRFSSVLTPIGLPLEVKFVGTLRMFVLFRKESRELMSASAPLRGLDT